MCLWIYCCWKAAHIWWITLVSSMRFSCSGCARTLHCNTSNKWSIGFKSRLFADHLIVCTLFATNITDSLLVCFYPPDIMRYPMPTSYRDWHGYEEKEPTEWRHFDTSSQLCFREWLHWSFRVHKYARQLPCRARGARAHNICSHLPFRMDSFVHGNLFSFP